MAARPASPLEELRSVYDGQRMSLEEYENLPEEKPYLEYWDGVVVQKPVPKDDHWIVADEVLAAICDYRRAHGDRSGPDGHVWFEGRGYRVPDVVYWAASKPRGSKERSLPPTLAVEIRSPHQNLNALRQKCREMCALGVDVCWLLDPEARWAEVYEGDSVREVPAEGSLTSQHLPGFELALSVIRTELQD